VDATETRVRVFVVVETCRLKGNARFAGRFQVLVSFYWKLSLCYSSALAVRVFNPFHTSTEAKLNIDIDPSMLNSHVATKAGPVSVVLTGRAVLLCATLRRTTRRNPTRIKTTLDAPQNPVLLRNKALKEKPLGSPYLEMAAAKSQSDQKTFSL